MTSRCSVSFAVHKLTYTSQVHAAVKATHVNREPPLSLGPTKPRSMYIIVFPELYIILILGLDCSLS